MQTATIKEDLKGIRYYYARKKLFEKASSTIGENLILRKIETYNKVIRTATPRLYDLYVSLYLENNTQESLSESLGYSTEYISELNRKLVKFFQDNIKEE